MRHHPQPGFDPDEHDRYRTEHLFNVGKHRGAALGKLFLSSARLWPALTLESRERDRIEMILESLDEMLKLGL